MLSDDNLHNSILFRPNSKSDWPPFLVPTSVSSPFQSASKLFANAASETKTNGSRKSIRIIKPETIKRAHNDGWMAAAIGDLEWLKQTLRITSEIAYDKNGFMTLHLACIHGRMNVIRYLVEEKQIDLNIPSLHGWRPVHLCISNQIGTRAVECLRYLLQKGADINLKNEDDIYPIHMAASEGHVECLRILLELLADTSVKDKRGHTPLDLAKLWGHRTCAKLLSSDVWHSNKNALHQQKTQARRVKTQDVLKEIEQAHAAYYETPAESQKHFDKWLVDQGFAPFSEESRAAAATSRSDHDTKMPPTTTTATMVDDSVRLPSMMSERRPLLRQDESIHAKAWNQSTKAKGGAYVTNLNDFYPRDPYTLLPEHLNMLLLSRELKGMSLEQIKAFMKSNLLKANIGQPSQLSADTERPVYFRPKNIVDAPSKVRVADAQDLVAEAGFNLTNDLCSFPFQEAKKFVNNRASITKNVSSVSCARVNACIDATSRKPTKLKPVNKKLEIVRTHFGDQLSEFMRDKRRNEINQRYEKVFIC